MSGIAIYHNRTPQIGDLSQVCLISASGSSSATVRVTFRNADKRVLVVSSAESNTLTIGSTAKSLSKHMVDASLSTGSKIPGIPDGAVDVLIECPVTSAADVCFNYGGTRDGSAGVGSGIYAANAAPTVNTTTKILRGQVYRHLESW